MYKKIAFIFFKAFEVTHEMTIDKLIKKLKLRS